tara:strand:- start:1025 stop:1318 length:294 start_codon:yes stop_codon:yes gene_type:complete
MFLYINPNTVVKPDTAQRYISLHVLPYTDGNKEALREEMTYLLAAYTNLSYRLLLTFAVTKEDLTDTLTDLKGVDHRIRNKKDRTKQMKQVLELIIQ